MKYQVGDKVELESGRIVIITAIAKGGERLIYGHGNPFNAIDERIIRKIED